MFDHEKGHDMSTAETVRDLALSLARAGLERAEAVNRAGSDRSTGRPGSAFALERGGEPLAFDGIRPHDQDVPRVTLSGEMRRSSEEEAEFRKLVGDL
jgi:hypothetical protein